MIPTYKLTLVLMLCLCTTTMFWSQTDAQRQEIRQSYDLDKLAALESRAKQLYDSNQKQAFDFAIANNIPMIVQLEDGGIAILEKMINGNPVYLTTDNMGAVQTTNTDEVQQGGSLGLNLEGQGMTVGIWDGGSVRPTHLGVAGRVTQKDAPAADSDHGTHVAGTMVASRDFLGGTVAGMAPQAQLQANDFSGDFAEMIPQSANGLLVSNHSYGFGADNLELYAFGSYDNAAALLDEVLFNAPFYTMVCSAGNDRGDGHNDGDGGYDLVTDRSCAKNNIVVAAVEEVAEYTGPEDVEMSSFSSWGPTDDGRVKPDISAKGVNMLSLGSMTDVTVGTKSGTSMATPNVSGSLILLQQLYSQLTGTFMKSATLKTVALHTAREAGDAPGPDYRFGWGLLNMEAAAQAILDNDFRSSLREESLSTMETYTQTVTATGNDPLVVTIVWTDPAAPDNGEVIDDTTPRLINDLDVRVMDSEGMTFMPWKLDVANFSAAATKGDNIVDNVEKIEIENPLGEYTITVSHKGTLLDNVQDFSILTTGINLGEFTLLPSKAREELCDTESTTFDFEFSSSDNYTSDTQLSVSGVPEMASANLNPSMLTEDGTFTLSIDNLNGVAQGTYPITVRATGDGLIKEKTVSLKVVSTSALDAIGLITPEDNAQETTNTPMLTWDAVPNAELYDLEISEVSDFSATILQITTAETSFQSRELLQNTEYFWRVKPSNSCVDGEFGQRSFSTETLDCKTPLTATDNPQTIDVVPTMVSSVVTVSSADADTVQDVNVSIDLTHTYTGDLTITLTSPQGTVVELTNGACGENDDIVATFNDAGNAVSCNLTAPTLSGNVQSKEQLSAFKGEDSEGDWTLTVIDGFNGDGGSLNEFALEICTTQNVLGLLTNGLEGFTMYPNPTSGQVNIGFSNAINSVDISVMDIGGRIVKTENVSANGQFNHAMSVVDLASGVYFVSVKNNNITTTRKLVIN